MAQKQGLGDLIDLVKAYAKQETLDPLKGAGRWVAMGVAGSLLMIIGGISLILAILRFLQEEGGSAVTGNLSWLPYLVTLVFVAIALGLLAFRLTKKTLQ